MSNQVPYLRSPVLHLASRAGGGPLAASASPADQDLQVHDLLVLSSKAIRAVFFAFSSKVITL
jgi:hypothetical protein